MNIIKWILQELLQQIFSTLLCLCYYFYHEDSRHDDVWVFDNSNYVILYLSGHVSTWCCVVTSSVYVSPNRVAIMEFKTYKKSVKTSWTMLSELKKKEKKKETSFAYYMYNIIYFKTVVTCVPQSLESSVLLHFSVNNLC